MAKGTGTKEAQAKLYLIIDGAGVQDKYIDADEEKDIFRQADELDIWEGWTRENEITYYLRVMLKEATADDGEIDKKEFDHIVGFAAAVRMPRKDAIRICCKLVREGGYAIQKEGTFKKKDWFADYEGRG